MSWKKYSESLPVISCFSWRLETPHFATCSMQFSFEIAFGFLASPNETRLVRTYVDAFARHLPDPLLLPGGRLSGTARPRAQDLRWPRHRPGMQGISARSSQPKSRHGGPLGPSGPVTLGWSNIIIHPDVQAHMQGSPVTSEIPHLQILTAPWPMAVDRSL